MADRHSTSPQTQRAPRPTATTTNSNYTPTTYPSRLTFLRKLQERAPNSFHVIGFMAFLITATVLLTLIGLTVTGTVLGLIVFTPLIILSSPIWIPVGTILFVVVAGFLSMCGFGVVVVAALSWMYRYYRGLHPPGSDGFDYARSRLFDTATHVKDYAREYGGYLQTKVKDAAPGA